MKSWIIIVDTRRVGGMLDTAQSIGASVSAVVVGSKSLADSVANRGFEQVLLFETAEGIPAEALAASVAKAAKEAEPDLVMSTDAASGRAVLAAIAGKLKTPVLSNVLALTKAEGALEATISLANGRAVEEVTCPGPLALIYAGDDAETAEGSATIEIMPTDELAEIRLIDTITENGEGVDLSAASRIVGVGMGIKSRDDLPLVDSLATALGAEIACTLPACDDMHWYPAERVLGSSHHSASPELYLALGVSGSPHHTSGARDARVFVAVNNDEDAEIFRRCDYGIVGDLYQIVPALTQALS